MDNMRTLFIAALILTSGARAGAEILVFDAPVFRPSIKSAAYWQPALTNFSAWTRTRQAERATAGVNARWWAFNELDLQTPDGRATITPLISVIEGTARDSGKPVQFQGSAQHRDWMHDRMMGLQTIMQREKRLSDGEVQQFAESFDRDLSMVGAPVARQVLAMVKQHIDRKDEPLDDKKALQARIRELQEFTRRLRGLGVYHESIGTNYAPLADRKLEDLQAAWADRWGDALHR